MAHTQERTFDVPDSDKFPFQEVFAVRAFVRVESSTQVTVSCPSDVMKKVQAIVKPPKDAEPTMTAAEKAALADEEKKRAVNVGS